MRERLDCALLAVGQRDWVKAVCGPRIGGRLVLHEMPPESTSPAAMLSDPALLRGRYDAGLIYVDEISLRPWRTALSAQRSNQPSALVIYAVGLRSQAIRDLLALGATDFMQPPFCVEELRARIEHNLLRPLAPHISETPPDYGPPPSAQASHPVPSGLAADTEARLCNTILDRSGSELEAYAVALATQRATSQASFRTAKGEIVARFERAYIRAALGRHGGNITLAAQMAQKHRRAFWALMQKHDIDPAPYRTRAADDPLPPGRSG